MMQSPPLPPPKKKKKKNQLYLTNFSQAKPAVSPNDLNPIILIALMRI